MYPVTHFKDGDPEEVIQFMEAHPFATLCGADENGKPVATQVPLLLEKKSDGRITLAGHLMRNTTHHKAFEKNAQVLCLFSGAHAYVSATWYANKQQASTWNYSSVQAHGTIQFLNDAALEDILQQTSVYFEKGNEASPTVLHNLPEAYTAPLLKAIVGFRITVTKLDHVFKLSQNRDRDSYESIINHLSNGGAAEKAVASAMQQRHTKVFTK